MRKIVAGVVFAIALVVPAALAAQPRPVVKTCNCPSGYYCADGQCHKLPQPPPPPPSGP